MVGRSFYLWGCLHSSLVYNTPMQMLQEIISTKRLNSLSTKAGELQSDEGAFEDLKSGGNSD